MPRNQGSRHFVCDYRDVGMGTFYTQIRIQNLLNRDREIWVDQALVDTGYEYTWVDGGLLESIGVSREKKDLTFTMANGQRITRSMGFAIVRSGDFFTVDEVVFAELGDLQLLGARSLEGFNARVDSQKNRLSQPARFRQHEKDRPETEQ